MPGSKIDDRTEAMILTKDVLVPTKKVSAKTMIHKEK